jgi:hypothetical protein
MVAPEHEQMAPHMFTESQMEILVEDTADVSGSKSAETMESMMGDMFGAGSSAAGQHTDVARRLSATTIQSRPTSLEPPPTRIPPGYPQRRSLRMRGMAPEYGFGSKNG